LQAVEKICQDFYHYGLRDYSNEGLAVPFLRMQIAVNPTPAKINYFQLQQIIQTFDDKITKAENTLAGITDGDVKLPLHFGMIHLDLKGSGKRDEYSTLWRIYAGLTSNSNIPPEKAEAFFIKFDRGDVHWLRGYCHVILACCEMYLAHDTEECFKRSGRLFFARVDSPYEFLARGKHFKTIGRNDTDILDCLAFVHLINFEVVAPQRMEAALHHLEAVIAQSRESWKWIMAETDDDHEWLPNPRQTGVIPNVRVTQEMVTAWAEIMNESERILSGQLLIPFWRGDEHKGINLRQVFLKPTRFDLVLWAQGSAALPYLEKRECTQGDTWRKLRAEFGPQFPGFALWFN